jgi:hypothetical protein
MPRWKRELAWAGIMLLEILLLAALTVVGGTLLNLGLITRPPEGAIGAPVFCAVWLLPILVGVAVAYWLAALLMPTIESSVLYSCLFQVFLVAIPCIAIGRFNGRLGVVLLVLGCTAVLAPRVLFPALRPGQRPTSRCSRPRPALGAAERRR